MPKNPGILNCKLPSSYQRHLRLSIASWPRKRRVRASRPSFQTPWLQKGAAWKFEGFPHERTIFNVRFTSLMRQMREQRQSLGSRYVTRPWKSRPSGRPRPEPAVREQSAEAKQHHISHLGVLPHSHLTSFHIILQIAFHGVY